jgi:hypothetical protein
MSACVCLHHRHFRHSRNLTSDTLTCVGFSPQTSLSNLDMLRTTLGGFLLQRCILRHSLGWTTFANRQLLNTTAAISASLHQSTSRSRSKFVTLGAPPLKKPSIINTTSRMVSWIGRHVLVSCRASRRLPLEILTHPFSSETSIRYSQGEDQTSSVITPHFIVTRDLRSVHEQAQELIPFFMLHLLG